jgi:hypothetical protein
LETTQPVPLGRYVGKFAAWFVGALIVFSILAMIFPEIAAEYGKSISLAITITSVMAAYQLFVERADKAPLPQRILENGRPMFGHRRGGFNNAAHAGLVGGRAATVIARPVDSCPVHRRFRNDRARPVGVFEMDRKLAA